MDDGLEREIAALREALERALHYVEANQDGRASDRTIDACRAALGETHAKGTN